MKCPACVETDLVMTDRQGVEIDYCPKCRGVWLDRGELDKIIERANRLEAGYGTPAAAGPPGTAGYGYGEPDRDDDDDDRHRHNRPPIPPPGYGAPPYGAPPPQHYDPRYDPRYRKKKSFWSELFDD